MLSESINALTYPQTTRGYIGASTLGHACDRYIYFQKEFNLETPLSRRTHSIFEIGKWLELHVIDLIKQTSDWSLVESQTEVSTEYVKGHTDGLLKHIPTDKLYLLEIKSMKDSSFKKAEKYGIRESHPQYYDQCQIYLSLTKDIDKLILIAINKNDGKLYEEVIDLNEKHAYNLLKKAERISVLKQMPIGLYNETKPRFECNFCNFKNICYGS